MKGFVKAIIVGAVIVVLGVILLVIALGLNGWSFKVNFETKDFTASQEISTIRLESKAGKVKIYYHAAGDENADKVFVRYPTSEQYVTEVTEQNGVLTVKGPNRAHWYNFASCNGWFDGPEMLIVLPQGREVALDLQINAGTLEVAAGTYSDVKVTLNAGIVNLGKIVCGSFTANVNAGDFNATSVECANCTTETNAGTLTLSGLKCGSINSHVNAGTLNLNIDGAKADYNITVTKNLGSCNVDSQQGATDKHLTVEANVGSANVHFAS